MELFHGCLDLLNALFVVLSAESVYFDLILLRLHFYCIGFFEDSQSVVVGLFASADQITEIFCLGFVSSLFNVENVIDLVFDSGAHIGRYFCLFSQLFQTCFDLFGLFFSLAPSLFHFWYLFVIVESWDTWFHNFYILFELLFLSYLFTYFRVFWLYFGQFYLQIRKHFHLFFGFYLHLIDFFLNSFGLWFSLFLYSSYLLF